MSTSEQKRVLVLNRTLEGHLCTAEAAPLLKLSKRPVQRLLAAYRKEGVAAVVHGNRGHSPTHRIDEETRQRIIALAQTTYAGANYQHLRDLLEERECRCFPGNVIRPSLVMLGNEKSRVALRPGQLAEFDPPGRFSGDAPCPGDLFLHGGYHLGSETRDLAQAVGRGNRAIIPLQVWPVLTPQSEQSM